MKNNKKYAVITFIVVGVFYVIMFIVTLIERNSNKIISPAETRDSSIYIIILACSPIVLMIATVYKGNIIKNLIMDCQSYTKYRPNETTGGIFVSWRRKEELPTGA